MRNMTYDEIYKYISKSFLVAGVPNQSAVIFVCKQQMWANIITDYCYN